MAAFCLLFLIVATEANNASLKLKADGDSKSVKTNTKENISGNSTTTASPAADNADYSYLRFDVTKYVNQDIDNSSDANSSPVRADNEFNYLRFDVSKYVSQDIPGSDGIDTTSVEPDKDYSYLKFDVTKYAGNGEDRASEAVNP
jgi:hypothetical protein